MELESEEDHSFKIYKNLEETINIPFGDYNLWLTYENEYLAFKREVFFWLECQKQKKILKPSTFVNLTCRK